MFRKVVFAVLVGLAFMWAPPTFASTIQFNPNGTGAGAGTITIDSFDWKPGNEISINSGGSTPQTPGQSVESLFQANMNTADLSTTAQTEYTSGNNGIFFTLVAGLPEVISPLSTLSTIQFDLAGPTPGAPNANNYF